jgi:hypothetical protein
VLGLDDVRTANLRNLCTSKLELSQLNDVFSLLELLMLREGINVTGWFYVKRRY